MKIVDAFLFSEEYEKDLLLLKMILSERHVTEWLICENAYSHQGDYTGLVAKKLIDTDERFAPYRSRITVIEASRQFQVIDKSKVQDDIAFICENWQRGLAYEYFVNNYSDEDWLALNDVDEMLDFTNEKKNEEFFTKLNAAKNTGVLQVPRVRYWFDFDNRFMRDALSVLCTKAYLVANNHRTLSAIRKHYLLGSPKGWEHIIVFEYSSCFDISHIIRKLETTAHTGLQRETLLQALRCNHRPVLVKKRIKPTANFFFETVELNEHNSPSYVRQHLSQLKVHNIDKNYKENRKHDYPQFFTFYYPIIEAFKNFINDNFTAIRKKSYFLLLRLGFKKK